MPRALLSLLLLAFAAPPAAAADLRLDAAAGFAIDATINGAPVRLRVDPAGSEHVILNPAAARRLGLGGSLIGSRAQIGPVRLSGSSNAVRLGIGGQAERHRLLWMDRPVIDGADGLIGPASLPFDRVTFALGPARPGETATVVPMRLAPRLGLTATLNAGDRPVAVQFALFAPDSLATAAAGALLAAAHDGAWTGAVRRQAIRFGVERPARPMRLARPAALAGFRFDRLVVRTSDNRGDLALPADPDADPGEILVTGASRQRAYYALTIGMDRLAQCSSLVWDNRGGTLTLNCLPPAAAGG
jgi:hypothetical protein